MSKLFLIAGASGAGKTTLIREALEAYPKTDYLTTYTTRLPRPELDEPEYIFVSQTAYESMRQQSGAWDHGEYYGQFYGCDVDEANKLLGAGVSLFSAVMPDLDEITRMRKLYDAETIVILVQSDENTRRLRLTSRGIVADLGRLSIDKEASNELESAADVLFCPTGSMQRDKEEFCQLIGGYLLCTEQSTS